LRRYAEDLPDYERVDRDVRVTMQSGLEADCDHSEALLVVGEQAIGGDGGSLTGILCTGGVDADLLRRVLGRLHAESITVEAAGVGDVAMVVVVGRRDGPNALRAIEATTAAV
jgi:hypothetical protein